MSHSSLQRPVALRLTKSEQERLGRSIAKTDRRHWVIAWWRFSFLVEVPERWCRQDASAAPAPVYRPRKEDSR